MWGDAWCGNDIHEDDVPLRDQMSGSTPPSYVPPDSAYGASLTPQPFDHGATRARVYVFCAT